MKSLAVSILAIATLLYTPYTIAQTTNGPYTIKVSEEFKSPKKHKVQSPVGYGKEGIVQVCSKNSESFAFQQFSDDLKNTKNRIISTENKLNERTSYNRFVKLKNKTYLFVRDVNRDAHTEGISALEFLPKELGFANKGKSLFQSSGPVRMGGFNIGYSWGFGYPTSIGNPSLGTASDNNYNFVLSKDKTKFLYTYALTPKEKKDVLNKDVIGMYVFDEDLNKQWGGEFEMPYTEAKMDNLGYTVANDGKVYLLAKVYETERPKETGKNKQPNYFFEVLVYDKNNNSKNSAPISIKLKLDEYFPKEVFIYEDAQGSIVVSGFYGKKLYSPIHGAYLVKLNIKNGVAEKINGDFYEIPNDIIKSYASDREKRKLENRENRDAEGDIGVDNLRIRKIYDMPNGSTKIISEQYVVYEYSYYDFNCKCYKTRYDTYADDIFVISIDANGKQEWVQKIPKAQHSADATGNGLSINTLAVGNNIHVFYIDNIKNLNLSPNEAPKRHENRRGGFLTAVKIDEKGNAEKYSLGEIDKYKTNFFIRGFVNGDNNNIISTERRKKKNKLFSIEVN